LKKAKCAFYTQRSKSKIRNIEFLLTFEEWYQWWLDQGVDKNQYRSDPRDGNALCMCRYNDAGPYSLDNIYCTTRQQNSKDARIVDPRDGNKRHRAVKTPLGIFKSALEAAKAHNVTTVTIRNRMPNGSFSKPGYDYVDYNYSCSQTIQTPYGLFPSLREAAKALKVHTTTITRRCKRLPQEYFYV